MNSLVHTGGEVGGMTEEDHPVSGVVGGEVDRALGVVAVNEGAGSPIRGMPVDGAGVSGVVMTTS